MGLQRGGNGIVDRGLSGEKVHLLTFYEIARYLETKLHKLEAYRKNNRFPSPAYHQLPTVVKPIRVAIRLADSSTSNRPEP